MSARRLIGPASSILLLVVSACADRTSGADSTGSGSESSTTTGSESSTTSVADTSTSGSSSTDPSESSSESEGSESESTTGPIGEIEATLNFLGLGQNCFKVIPPDPLVASWSVGIIDNGGAQTADVVSATFYDLGDAAVATIDVSPTTIDLTAGDALMTKEPDSLMPANGCETLICDDEYRLELVIEAGGMQFTITGDPAAVSCTS